MQGIPGPESRKEYVSHLDSGYPQDSKVFQGDSEKHSQRGVLLESILGTFHSNQ